MMLALSGRRISENFPKNVTNVLTTNCYRRFHPTSSAQCVSRMWNIRVSDGILSSPRRRQLIRCYFAFYRKGRREFLRRNDALWRSRLAVWFLFNHLRLATICMVISSNRLVFASLSILFFLTIIIYHSPSSVSN